MVKPIPLSIGIIIIILLYLNLKKDHFKTIQQEKEIDYDNTYRPHGYTNSLKKTDNSGITKSFLTNLISDYSNHFNANGGANVSVYQNKYDLFVSFLL